MPKIELKPEEKKIFKPSVKNRSGWRNTFSRKTKSVTHGWNGRS